MAMWITEYSSMIKTESNLTRDCCQCCLSRASRADFKKMSTVGSNGSNDSSDKSYHNMLISCFSIIIENSAGVDCLICDICISRLEESHRFKCQVENSQIRLKEALNNAIEQKYSREDQFCDDDWQNETIEITVQDVKIDIDEIEKQASKSNITKMKVKTTNKNREPEMLQSDLRSIKKDPQKHIKKQRTIAGSQSSTLIKNDILRLLPTSSRVQNINQVDASESSIQRKQEEKFDKSNCKTIQNSSNTDIVKVKRLIKNDDITIESNKTKLNLETAEKKPRIKRKKITIDKSRTCDVCGELFPNYLSKRKHINIHYPNYICDQCGMPFINMNSIISHLKSHEKETSPCSKCGKVIKIQCMKQHMATHLPRTERFPCSLCNLKFDTVAQRVNHMKTIHDTDIYIYICKMCPKKFTTGTYLRKHVCRSHLSKFRFHCETCGKGFYTKINLQDHIGVHTGIKNETCDICSRSFVKRWNMHQHRKSHFKNNNGRSVKDALS